MEVSQKLWQIDNTKDSTVENKLYHKVSVTSLWIVLQQHIEHKIKIEYMIDLQPLSGFGDRKRKNMFCCLYDMLYCSYSYNNSFLGTISSFTFTDKTFEDEL